MNFTKKEEVLNEEIGRYSIRAEEDLSELRINYEKIRKINSSISVGYDIDNIRYAITDLIENKYPLIENENLEDVDEKIRELSEKFDAIIDLARKARENLTSLKIDSGSISAFKKVINN
jgi:ABC-type enterochelin transport system substrate-binding protein